MSWEQLLSISKENQQEYDRVETEAPTSCPNDGEPLQTSNDGTLWCPFDGWEYCP